MSKAALRRTLGAERRGLGAEAREAAASALVERLIAIVRAGVVLGFAPIRSEIDLRPALDRISRHQPVALPRMEGPDLVPVPLVSWEALVVGRFGVREPSGAPLPVVHTVLTPGLGFTAAGARLGYGGGFYDRFFTAHPRALRIAVGFDLQLVDRLPTEPHDAPVDVVVTPGGTLWTGARGRSAP
ncbi:MAG: 5-formyltetrahydrofolate cyclo-ligase [Myxococcota bacterium]|jgi:5-formyltetrahydrofolate cyclo-ligase